MGNAIIYIHGKGGSASESEHYKPLFPECDVIGLDYRTFTPWETGAEIRSAVEKLKAEYEKIILIANSIGAFFSMNADIDSLIEKAYFISPIVDMEKLITDMMAWANVTENELKEKGIIHTAFGEDLSWEYLCYVREHPIKWSAPTAILYGSKDNLTSYETVAGFADKYNAKLTVMENGEHWFHTEEQMRFLDDWIRTEHQTTEVNGKPYQIIRLLGKGKGGYSYLAESEGKQVVLKQIHHEPCDYYTFGNKIEAEKNDYQRLLDANIRIPKMFDIDMGNERIVKEYIDGDTIFEMVKNDISVEAYQPQVREMAQLAKTAGLNIDYFPTNFVVQNGLLYYIDYECNSYMDEWSFENWGVKYWSKTPEFMAYLEKSL